MRLIDCHTHTRFSMDSEADEHAMIRRACELGLAAYAVTDHCECNWWYPEEHYGGTELSEDFNFGSDFESSVSAISALKKRYSDKIELICGTELGQATHDLEIAEKVAADPRLDFVIGSLHQIRGEKDFYFIDYEQYSEHDIYELLERYFTEVHEMCKWGKFDVLGHLTYALRYMKCRCGIEPDISRFDDIIAEAFRELIIKDKGIEINTSGLRQGFGTTFPPLKYARLFRDLGGELITVGSDAHTVEDLGSDIIEGTRLAAEAGFTRLCFFKQRKPHFIDIT